MSSSIQINMRRVTLWIKNESLDCSDEIQVRYLISDDWVRGCQGDEADAIGVEHHDLVAVDERPIVRVWKVTRFRFMFMFRFRGRSIDTFKDFSPNQ